MSGGAVGLFFDQRKRAGRGMEGSCNVGRRNLRRSGALENGRNELSGQWRTGDAESGSERTHEPGMWGSTAILAQWDGPRAAE